ncbi:MAG TPA: TIGR00266 family protein [Thermoanaerobaculia bacterium]|nr:TIGR00266 family protein [Thermoanaerobaculia bacterium]
MSDKFWYVAVGGQQQGPISRDEVVSGIRSGRFGRDTHVFSQGMANWVPITSQQEFAEAFSGPGTLPPPPPPGMAGPAPARAHEIDYELFGEDMQYLEVTLDPGEACIAEAGAFMYMDPGIQMQTIFGDGSGQDQGGGFMGKLLSAGKRVITGESLFMTLFGNSGGSRQKVAFAAPYPGKIIPVDLKQHGGRLLCEKDAFLCAAKGISVGIALNRKLGAGLFGGEGFILQKLEGDGLAFLHSGGTILSRQLNPGETLRVDTGCLVAFESTVNYDIQMVSGIKTAFFGGEGLFYATLTGPGKIWLQSLPFKRLAMQVLSAIPRNKGEGSALGGIGTILMGGGD